MMAYALPLVLALLVIGSQQVTNPEDMGKEFARAQRLLAGGDFAGAQRLYDHLLAVPDGRLLRASQVAVRIGERQVGLQEAARYQLGNLTRQQARLWRQEADLAGPAAADSLAGLARQGLRQAAAYFAGLGEESGFALREEAMFLAMECLYEAEDYAQAAAAGRGLLAVFPQGAYAARTRFNLGWALFHLQEYAEAASAFAAFVQQEPHTIRADRARLQWGMALEQVGRLEEALALFAALAESYDPGSMSFEERTAVALAGLREGHSRRTLAARAWIKRGEVLAALGRFEEALAAYKKLGEDFPQEERLTELAWVRQAALARQTDGPEAALAVYRYAGERAGRPVFRARMQAELMTLLFEEESYEEALAAHRLYLAAYAGLAEEAGLPVGETHFRIAECLRLLGEARAAAAAHPDTVAALFDAALEGYAQAQEQVGDYLLPEALFWQGYTYQLLGRDEAAHELYVRLQREYPDTDLACRATLQAARLAVGPEAGRPEALYDQILAQCQEPEVRALAALELGHRRRLQGRLREARELLETIQADQPHYASAQMELAQLLTQAGETAAAIALLERLLEQQTEPGLQAQLGLLYQRQGEDGRALGLLQAALPHLQGSLRAVARFGVGWSHYRQGELEEAWTIWRAGLEEGGLEREQQRTYLRALGLCARELEDPQRLAELHAALLSEEDLRIESRLALARFHLDRGDPEAAVEQVRGLETHPDSGVALQARLLLGRGLLGQGQAAAARQAFSAGLALAPEAELAAEYSFSLGSALTAEGEWGAAAAAFAASLEQAVERPVQAEALYYLAHSLLAVGDPAAARDRFAALATAYPESHRAPQALFQAAEADYWAGDFVRALEGYTRLAAHWPQAPQVPQALYGAGWCALELADEEAMARHFLDLARRYPGHSHASEGLMHLGDYYYNAGKRTQAEELYARLVREFPEAPQAAAARQLLVHLRDGEADVLYSQGMARFDEGEYAEAIALLQEVVAGYPGTPSEAAARCNIAMAYQRLHDWRQAARLYTETLAALEDRPEEQAAREFARRHLAQITGSKDAEP